MNSTEASSDGDWDITTKPCEFEPEGLNQSVNVLGPMLGLRYEILKEVGRGGMGVVFKARHRALAKDVAIKVLLPGMSVERFYREARLLAQLDTPHVVKVHDFDVLGGDSPILVMEWVEGHDLAHVCKERGGRIEETEALSLMSQVAHGLAQAAGAGIVHRDVKPANILVDARGRVRVADFGLARGTDGTGMATLTDCAMGTPFYMAPEQAEDPRTVDTRADIYSFGATFYHILTGSPPFVGSTPFSTFFKAKTEPLVSPKSLIPKLSNRTGDLLEKCLAKSPAARFQSFEEVLRHVSPASIGTSPWDEPEDPSIAAILARYQSRRDGYLNSEHLFPDVYPMSSGRKLFVARGSIATQQVDAIVSSDDEMISMGGGVSRALKYAAGPTMEAEARKYVPVRAGRAVVTSAGKLSARFIFHGITLNYSKPGSARPSRDLILEILASCFYHADTLNVKTIAFPLLGTGAGGFPTDICLDATFHFLARTLSRGMTSVQEATIVIYGGSRP